MIRKPLLREILESILVSVILTLFIRTWILQAFEIPTPSMEPNLLVGDHLLVNKLAYSPSLGVFEAWLLGKRATPVPAGELFVLGDNRDRSRDSRSWGFVARDQIKGRALIVYWSYPEADASYHRAGFLQSIEDSLAAWGDARFDRLGLVIR